MPDGFDKLLGGGGATGGGGFDNLLGTPSQAQPAQPSESGGLIASIPGASTVLSAVAPALDFLSRGQYASAGFFDALINDNAGVLDALGQAGSELINPSKRRSFSDVLSRYSPDFAANNPIATKVIGFLGDVALDPTTYLGLGLGAATKGARIGARGLTTLGETLRGQAIRNLADKEITLGLGRATAPDLFTKLGPTEAALALGRESLTRLPEEIGQKATFGAVESAGDLLAKTQQSVGADIRSLLGGKLPAGVTDAGLDDLAGQISLERLGLPNVGAAADPLSTITRRQGYGEIVESADQLITRIAAMSPEAGRAIFKPGGVKLKIGIPFTSAQGEIPIINSNVLRAVGLDRLDGVIKAVAALPGIKQAVSAGKTLRGAVDRFYELPETYVRTITKLQDEYDFVKQDVVRDVLNLTERIPADGRERISKVLNSFQAGVESLDDAERLAQAPQVFRMAMRQATLKPEEQAVVMSLIQGYGRAAELERAATVGGQLAANFDPRVYKALENIDEAENLLGRVEPGGAIDATGLTAQQIQKAADLSQAIAEGANVEQDAVLLYAQKAIQARQAVPRKQAEQALEAMYGKGLANAPARVMNDWRYFGEYRFPTFNDESSDILRSLDWLQSKFKLTKTVLNPSFAPRQAVSNSIQAALAMGNNAYRALDPRSFSAAARIVFGNRQTNRAGLGQFAENWLSKFTNPEDFAAVRDVAVQNLDRADEAANLARGMEFTLPTGYKLTLDELDALARQNGILRGTTGYSGEMLKRSLQDEIGTGRPVDLSGKGYEGAKKLLEGYLGAAGKVEDVSRLGLFLNGLMMGDSATGAAQRVNRALFDYGRSFSRFEQEVAKRIFPFYSFQRLAVPFVLRETLENPAAPTTLNKVSDLLGRLITGDENGQPVTLSPAEREIFGRSFLVEQPRVFRGFDKENNPVFNVFSNLTPFDIFSLFTVSKKNGEVDLQRTAEKTILGAMTPYLKVPAELLTNRSFFDDKVLNDARGYGGAGKLGKIKDGTLDTILPESIKEAIGWEWGRDRRTGEPVAYVNPYLAYTMAQLAPPVAKQFIKPLRDDETVLERAMKLVTGINEQAVDLRQAQAIQNTEDKKYIGDLRQQVVAASKTGRKNEMEQALDDYRRVLRQVSQRRATIAQGGTIRGSQSN